MCTAVSWVVTNTVCEGGSHWEGWQEAARERMLTRDWGDLGVAVGQRKQWLNGKWIYTSKYKRRRLGYVEMSSNLQKGRWSRPASPAFRTSQTSSGPWATGWQLLADYSRWPGAITAHEGNANPFLSTSSMMLDTQMQLSNWVSGIDIR